MTTIDNIKYSDLVKKAKEHLAVYDMPYEGMLSKRSSYVTGALHRAVESFDVYDLMKKPEQYVRIRTMAFNLQKLIQRRISPYETLTGWLDAQGIDTNKYPRYIVQQYRLMYMDNLIAELEEKGK